MMLLQKSLMTAATLYFLYILKWAVGINILPDFQAPRFVKLPAEIAVTGIQQLGIEVTLPGQSKRDQNPRNMAAHSTTPLL